MSIVSKWNRITNMEIVAYVSYCRVLFFFRSWTRLTDTSTAPIVWNFVLGRAFATVQAQRKTSQSSRSSPNVVAPLPEWHCLSSGHPPTAATCEGRHWQSLHVSWIGVNRKRLARASGGGGHFDWKEAYTLSIDSKIWRTYRPRRMSLDSRECCL